MGLKYYKCPKCYKESYREYSCDKCKVRMRRSDQISHDYVNEVKDRNYNNYMNKLKAQRQEGSISKSEYEKKKDWVERNIPHGFRIARPRLYIARRKL